MGPLALIPNYEPGHRADRSERRKYQPHESPLAAGCLTASRRLPLLMVIGTFGSRNIVRSRTLINGGLVHG